MLDRRYLYGTRTAVGGGPPPAPDTPYADLVASLGGVAYWPLQDTSGDEEINGHDLTFEFATGVDTGPGGELAAAVSFTGQYATAGNVAALRPTTGLSVIGWFNAPTDVNGRNLWGCGNTGFSGYQCSISTNPGLSARVKNGTDTQNVTLTLGSTAGGWAFIAQTYDKTAQRVYVDAELAVGGEDASTFDIGYSGTPSFYLCDHTGSAANFQGLVAGVAVFPTGLTQGNLEDLYEAVTT